MKLFFLDNSYTDYVIMAESREDAWRKLREKEMILLPYREGEEELEDDSELTHAYNDLEEVTDETMIDNPHDLRFVL